MTKSDIDWTFEDAPRDDEASAGNGALSGAPPPPPGRHARLPRWLRRIRVWQWALIVGLLIAGIGLGLWTVTRRGERQLLAQLTAEVEYEDAHSRAGEADLALSVWAEPGPLADPAEPLAAWRLRRLAEIDQRLAAPLPVNSLTPDETGPRVIEVVVSAVDPSIWVATVVRTYHDASGHTLSFALPQSYHNLGPGLWERVPPASAALANTTIVTGQRLSATVPVTDLPWLEDSLVAADAALVRACADWGPEACGEAKATFIFTGLLQQLPPVQLPFGQTMGQGLYPLTFDLAPFMLPAPAPVMLPSPRIAGLPVDEDARAALTQAITVYGLIYLADSIAGPNTRPFEADYFGDGLVARAELRLGLSTPPTYSLQARDYLPIASLWEDSRRIPHSLGLPMRLQALSFLETALAGQPATVDAALLRMLRRQPNLTDWLAEALGAEGVTQAVSNWEAQAATLFEAEGTLSWTALEGLSYTCDTGTYLVRDGAAKLLSVAPLWSALDFPTQALSPDGQYLALVNQVAADQVALTIYDLKMAATVTITQAASVFVAGWSRGQELVYIAHDAPDDPSTNSASPYHLLSFDQTTGNSRRLVENAVLAGSNLSGSWLPDRRSLVLNFDFQDDAAVPSKLWAPAVVSVDGAEAGGLTWLLPMEPRTAYGFLAPNGQWIAYVQRTADDGSFVVANLVLLDIATGARQVILKSKSGADSDGIPIEGDTLSLLGWSGDSAQLMFSTGGTGVPPVTYLFPIDGSRAPLEVARADDNLGVFTSVAHSPDGRYLSYRTFGSPDPVALRLIDLESLDKVEAGTTLVQTLALESSGSAWSTIGHRLAVAGLAGLRVIDLDTGLVRWVETGNCSAVAWYPPPVS